MKLGIFGGTFDPPHLGHLILAAEAHAQLQLDKVLWVLTGLSPFKLDQKISPAPVRVAMVQAAIADNPAFALSQVDLERPAPHYTVDTLARLAEQYSEATFFYLLGEDSLYDLPGWRNPQQIIKQCRLAVLRRPGSTGDLRALEAKIAGISERVVWVDAPQLEIAATDIRRRVREGRPIRYLVPDAVRELIAAHELY